MLKASFNSSGRIIPATTGHKEKIMKQNAKPFEIKQLSKEDLPAFKSLINLFNIVFEEEQRLVGSDPHLTKLLGSKSFVAITALSEHEVVGGMTAYELPMVYSDSSEIILYDMAVRADFQRMGIGKKLIQGLKEYCIENGIKEFFVLAHEEDRHAVEFYHSTGGKSEKVVNFLYGTGDA
jgi:aminoglycoside 3-N-acetyltransferase I